MAIVGLIGVFYISMAIAYVTLLAGVGKFSEPLAFCIFFVSLAWASEKGMAYLDKSIRESKEFESRNNTEES